MTTKMFAPAGLTGIVNAPSGNLTIAADGSVQAQSGDVISLIGAGFTAANRTSNNANGLASTALPLTEGKNSDGSVLAAAASSGKFGITTTIGTSEVLSGEVANNNTKTDTVMFEKILPPNYVAGQDITLTVDARIIIGAGTAGSTKSLTATAYKKAADGTEGANLIATAAATLTNSIVGDAFVITGTTLNPGDNLIIKLVVALQETASSAINAEIESVTLS